MRNDGPPRTRTTDRDCVIETIDYLGQARRALGQAPHQGQADRGHAGAGSAWSLTPRSDRRKAGIGIVNSVARARRDLIAQVAKGDARPSPPRSAQGFAQFGAENCTPSTALGNAVGEAGFAHEASPTGRGRPAKRLRPRGAACGSAVGEAGFEPATTSTQSSCTTGLCASPVNRSTRLF